MKITSHMNVHEYSTSKPFFFCTLHNSFNLHIVCVCLLFGCFSFRFHLRRRHHRNPSLWSLENMSPQNHFTAASLQPSLEAMHSHALLNVRLVVVSTRTMVRGEHSSTDVLGAMA